MSHFSVGDRVRDVRVNWPRCNQTGTVVSVQNNTITWRSDYDNKVVTDPIGDMRLVNRNRPRRLSNIKRNTSFNYEQGK